MSLEWIVKKCIKNKIKTKQSGFDLKKKKVFAVLFLKTAPKQNFKNTLRWSCQIKSFGRDSFIQDMKKQ